MDMLRQVLSNQSHLYWNVPSCQGKLPVFRKLDPKLSKSWAYPTMPNNQTVAETTRIMAPVSSVCGTPPRKAIFDASGGVFANVDPAAFRCNKLAKMGSIWHVVAYGPDWSGRNLNYQLLPTWFICLKIITAPNYQKLMYLSCRNFDMFLRPG